MTLRLIILLIFSCAFSTTYADDEFLFLNCEIVVTNNYKYQNNSKPRIEKKNLSMLVNKKTGELLEGSIAAVGNDNLITYVNETNYSGIIVDKGIKHKWDEKLIILTGDYRIDRINGIFKANIWMRFPDEKNWELRDLEVSEKGKCNPAQERKF